MAVFTESWLDDSTPDSAVSIEGYSICRRDRCRNGGGIVAYVEQAYTFRVLTASDIPSLSTCESEFLAIQFTNTPLFVIGVYHPFWNDTSRNDQCMSCIAEMIDHVLITSQFDTTIMRLVVCGDFNGLHHCLNEFSSLCQLTPVVSTPTRENNVLDQIFVNYRVDCVPRVLPPMGKSDHKIVFWDAAPRAVKSTV